MHSLFVRASLVSVCAALAVMAQQKRIIIPPGFQLPQLPNQEQPAPAKPPAAPPAQAPAAAPQQAAPAPAQQPAAQPAAPAPTTAAPAPTPAAPAPPVSSAAAPTPAPAAPAAPAQSFAGLSLQNASLVEVIDMLARELKINYILDPRVKGGVILNTYGEVKDLDKRALLDVILRINGFAMVQVGPLYRIVPLPEASRLPLMPQVSRKPTGADENDQIMLNLVFLRYMAVDDVIKLLADFQGEGAKMWAYTPANLLLIQDSARNMRRLMELIALFDGDAFSGSRVRSFPVENSRPSDLAKELETIFKSISLNEKSSPIKFLALDRINTIIGIASNPSVFDEVERWVEKLDVQVTSQAGQVDNYVYRVKYQSADMLAIAIMQLYGVNLGFGGGMGMGGFGNFGGFGGAFGGMGMGGMGMGGMGGMGMGGMGMGGMGMGGMGMGGYGGVGLSSPGAGIIGGPGAGVGYGAQAVPGAAPGTAATANMTGAMLGQAAAQAAQNGVRIPRVTPVITDNSLLIQATPQEYESILKLLRQLDVSPRQVLIEAKVYEVTLSGLFASGIQAYLRQQGAGGAAPVDPNPNNPNGGVNNNRPLPGPTDGPVGLPRQLLGSVVGNTTALSIGTLVGRSRELLGILTLQEGSGKVKTLSEPSIIATDSIPAAINVGTEVPTVTSQGATGVVTGGTTQFAQTISNRNTGVTLQITPRISPSGIVTLQVNQEYSQPQPSIGGIASPSFLKRNVQTQLTLQDGDTIAIGGIITDQSTFNTRGLPFINRIPILGTAFGSRDYSRSRTELVIFLTPRVIYDSNDLVDASDELRSKLRRVNRLVRE